MKKEIAIGIPAYNAHSTIENALCSINIQSVRDKIKVYIANDEPEGKDYSDIIRKFPDIEIEELSTDKNGGPGVARNRCIEASNETYIAFMDADDVLYNPYVMEQLLLAVKKPNTIQAQGVFLQEGTDPSSGNHRLIPINNPNHPWSFARLTNLDFLKKNGINFGTLRAMEDGRFEWCIRLLIEGTPLKIEYINDFCYVWKEGSEHSITRTGTELNGGIPLYNYSLCQIGASIASKQAIDFAQSKNPFNGNIQRFAVEQMIGHYFTYYECLERCPKFAEQNWWLSKWFYHDVFTKYCSNLSYDVLEKFYMQMLSAKGKELNHFPELTFKQWLDKVAKEEYSLDELVQIRDKLPEEITDAEKRTGVLTDNILEMFS